MGIPYDIPEGVSFGDCTEEEWFDGFESGIFYDQWQYMRQKSQQLLLELGSCHSFTHYTRRNEEPYEEPNHHSD